MQRHWTCNRPFSIHEMPRLSSTADYTTVAFPNHVSFGQELLDVCMFAYYNAGLGFQGTLVLIITVLLRYLDDDYLMIS